MGSFQDYLDKSSKTEDLQGLVDTFLLEVKQYGYDKMIFGLLSDHSHIGLSAGIGYLNNYPESWMKYYFENGFDQIDPVVAYCRQNVGSFTWDEMSSNLDLKKKQKTCLDLAREAQLHNGICTPLWGPQRFAGIGLASSNEKDATDSSPEALDHITAICNHFYLVFQRRHAGATLNNEDLNNVFLTPKEYEVLTWASRGKSNNDIGDILNISDNTVNFHLKQIYKKLQVNDRVVACTKAITLGLIFP
ncbi:MAG: helix-turn-helix transcriptional regulator [Alphaproteobacteria bacterium]